MLIVPLAALGGSWLDLRGQVQELRTGQERALAALERIEGEITRIRIEQRAEGSGVTALLEKLDYYAPLLTNASVPEPDYRWMRKEMDAILRAFASIGTEAYEPILERFLSIPAGEQFDRRKWLLEAALAADPVRGKDLVQRVLRGYEPDVPVGSRLRWYAADVLLRVDKARAGLVLREILRSESSRGPRRGDVGMPADIQASSGFDKFVARYVASDDPEMENTLVMILGRPEHDLMTHQSCVKALGELESRKAVPFIQKLFQDPPVIHENPIFQNHCLDALAEILGSEACPFFQQELRNVRHELVQAKLRELIKRFDCK